MTTEDQTDKYADQPHPPGAKENCKDIPASAPPPLAEPKCDEPYCLCPEGPGSTSNCIEDLIAKQAAEIAAAEKAKAFKVDLEALLGKARTASQDYTQEKYEKFCKLWVEEDGQIAELIRKLECTVDCWKCVIDCTVCPLFNDLHIAQQWLYGDGTLYKDVHNLYDLQYWHTRDKDKKERRFNRIRSVLAAWETPAKTIEAIFAANAKIILDANKAMGSAPGSVIYDIFFRLVPMHLAIAPVNGLNWNDKNKPWNTNILKEYTEFCPCDKPCEKPCNKETDEDCPDDCECPDDCCGPDVGEWSQRQRLLKPQPYLVDPNKYFDLVCCLVEKRYEPAKNALGKAEADLAAVDDRIKNLKAKIENAPNSFEKDAKGAIPSVINCEKYPAIQTGKER
jgi:hypothetical protein